MIPDLYRKGSFIEEGILFSTLAGVFYKPKMRFSRSVSSLAVSAIDSKLDLIDAFCASGIRGIRYAKENSNVNSVCFVDVDSNAIKCVRKNAKKAKIKCAVKDGNISKVAFDISGNFVEIDPFGTPSPYLIDALRILKVNKEAYLSVTATDVAVLCGAKTAACMKNYQSKPLNCTFTHEIGLRILIMKIANSAAEFNFGITPLISFSDQHYLKVILKLIRNADSAYSSQKKFGYVSFCKNCAYRSTSDFPSVSCPFCNHSLLFAGPVWLGELHTSDFLNIMKNFNDKRNYEDKEKISKFLDVLVGETNLPPFYYNIHELCKLHKIQPIPKLEEFLKTIRDFGFIARKTHFSPISIKTNCPHQKLISILTNFSKSENL